MLKRFRCRLVGCCEHEQAPACFRCGTCIYDPDYVEYGRAWLSPVRNLLASLRYWVGRRVMVQRCCSCGKRLWPWSHRVHGDHCTEECFDKWIPF